LRNGFHNRRAVREELERYFEGKGYVTRFGPINDGGRNEANEEYLRTLARSKIVVTCQPDRWEGDWRTWEAFASGACVISDRVWLESHGPEPDYWLMTPGKGVYHHDHMVGDFRYIPIGELIERLLKGNEYQLRSHRCIGIKGQDHTENSHRPSNRIDEILWQLKELQA